MQTILQFSKRENWFSTDSSTCCIFYSTVTTKLSWSDTDSERNESSGKCSSIAGIRLRRLASESLARSLEDFQQSTVKRKTTTATASSTATTTALQMNPDLQRERDNATFDVERVTHMLDGGKARTERRHFLEAVIERDPTGIFNNKDNHYMHRTERHVRGIAKGVRLIELCRKLGIGDECGGEIIQSRDFHTILDAVADDIPLGMFS
jgi:hypothetical protein